MLGSISATDGHACMLRAMCEVRNTKGSLNKKMLESRSEDALILLVKLVKSTVMTVETDEIVETM